MKAYMRTTLLLTLVLSLYAGHTVFASEFEGYEELRLSINNRLIETGVPALLSLSSDQIFIPLRVAAEHMGYTITWDSKNRVAAISRDGETIYLNTAEYTIEMGGRLNTIANNRFIIKDGRILLDGSLFYRIFFIGQLQSEDITYTVQSGDTLNSISQLFFGRSNPETWELIRAANGMTNDNLRPGMVIIIPEDRGFSSRILYNEATKTVDIATRARLFWPS